MRIRPVEDYAHNMAMFCVVCFGVVFLAAAFVSYLPSLGWSWELFNRWRKAIDRWRGVR